MKAMKAMKAMIVKTGGNRSLRGAAALAVVAAATVLATAACGVHISLGSGHSTGSNSAGSSSAGAGAPDPAGSYSYTQVLALAQCMRSHGLPDFPDPGPSGGYSLTPTGSLKGAGGSVDINSSQAQAAYGDCRHLLPGGPSISQLEQAELQAQQRQAQTLPLLLKYVQCMRSHGVPNFPSPGQSAPTAHITVPDVNSPQYLAAEGTCQHLLPPGAQVSLSPRQSTS